MKKITTPVKNFVRAHKHALVIGIGLGTVVVLQHKGIQSLNEFLTEKGLSDEYYSTVD